MQGRVFTLLLSSISLMAPFGLALGGPVADAFGIPMVFIITGIGCLVIALVWLSSPTILHLEDKAERPETTVEPVKSPAG
jgi:DHA3 family macrolide efflux protein-like MFS transporter